MPAGVNFFLARLGPPAAAASGRICVHARLRLSGCGEGKRERRWRGRCVGGEGARARRGGGWGGEKGLRRRSWPCRRRRHSPPAVARKRAWLSASVRAASLKIRVLRGRGRRGLEPSPPGMRLTAQGACTIRVGKSGKLCRLVGSLWKSCSKKALQEAWTPRGGSCCLRSTARGLR